MIRNKEKHRLDMKLRREKYPFENSWIAINSQRKKLGKKAISKENYIKYYNFMKQFEEYRKLNKRGKPPITVDFFLKLVRRGKIKL